MWTRTEYDPAASRMPRDQIDTSEEDFLELSDETRTDGTELAQSLREEFSGMLGDDEFANRFQADN